MPDPLPAVERAARDILAASAEAVLRYAEVSGLPPGEDLRESFLTAFVFDRLGGRYAMTLETNGGELLVRDAVTRDRSGLASRRRAAALNADIGRLDPKRRVDLVLYADEPGERLGRPFLALVEFKLWAGWPADRAKLLPILSALETCPFGVMCFLVMGASAADRLGWYAEEARRAGDLWLVEEIPGVLHRGQPLSLGAQIVRRPAAGGNLGAARGRA